MRTPTVDSSVVMDVAPDETVNFQLPKVAVDNEKITMKLVHKSGRNARLVVTAPKGVTIERRGRPKTE